MDLFPFNCPVVPYSEVLLPPPGTHRASPFFSRLLPGKSTLARALAHRLGVHHVLATDSLRQHVATLDSRPETDTLRCSTYDAYLKLTFDDHVPHIKKVIRGYKAQADAILRHARLTLDQIAATGTSVVLEGVHLRPRGVAELARAYASRGVVLVPFLVHVPEAEKHGQWLRNRARMCRGASRYERYFANIRSIQAYLVRAAEKHAIPVIRNCHVLTDILDVMEATVRRCLTWSYAPRSTMNTGIAPDVVGSGAMNKERNGGVISNINHNNDRDDHNNHDCDEDKKEEERGTLDHHHSEYSEYLFTSARMGPKMTERVQFTHVLSYYQGVVQELGFDPDMVRVPRRSQSTTSTTKTEKEQEHEQEQ